MASTARITTPLRYVSSRFRVAKEKCLEARERERGELLDEVTAMAEEHGLDAGALKAVMGG